MNDAEWYKGLGDVFSSMYGEAHREDAVRLGAACEVLLRSTDAMFNGVRLVVRSARDYVKAAVEINRITWRLRKVRVRLRTLTEEG